MPRSSQNRGRTARNSNPGDHYTSNSDGTHKKDHRPARSSRHNLPPVPSKTQVTPGRQVSIVLKADQVTGRQVSGTVAHVLTAGDHPRGIKVRLSDGRVGRVQRLIDSAGIGPSSGTASLLADQNLQNASNQTILASRQDEPDALAPRDTGNIGRRENDHGLAESFQKPRYRDIRLDDRLEAPETEYDLFSFVKIKAGKGRKNSSRQTTPLVDASSDIDPSALTLREATKIDQNEVAGDGRGTRATTVHCPICQDFMGDETAVSHHVEWNHFAS